MSTVGEAFLSKHFYRRWAELYERRFGLRFSAFLRPGEDGGLVGRNQNADLLRLSLTELWDRPETARYLVIFLQYKLVEQRLRRGPYTPDGFPSVHCRFELDGRPDPLSGVSQHERLVALSALPGATAYYACGMLTRSAEVLAPPDLDDLFCLSPQPQSFAAESRHFVMFRSPGDRSPLWDGQHPVRAMTPAELMDAGRLPKPCSPEEVRELILSTYELLHRLSAAKRERHHPSGTQLSLFNPLQTEPSAEDQTPLPDAMMIMEFLPPEDNRA